MSLKQAHAIILVISYFSQYANLGLFLRIFLFFSDQVDYIADMAGGAELVNKLNSLEIENKNLKKGKWSHICDIAIVSIIPKPNHWKSEQNCCYFIQISIGFWQNGCQYKLNARTKSQQILWKTLKINPWGYLWVNPAGSGTIVFVFSLAILLCQDAELYYKIDLSQGHC